MKKVLMIMLASCLSAGAFAQSKMSDSKMSKMEGNDKMQSKMKEGFEMKEGIMMVIKDGSRMELKENIKLTNGTVVMTNGMLKTKEGKMVQLKEGETVDINGNITEMKMNKMDNKMKSKI